MTAGQIQHAEPLNSSHQDLKTLIRYVLSNMVYLGFNGIDRGTNTYTIGVHISLIEVATTLKGIHVLPFL